MSRRAIIAVMNEIDASQVTSVSPPFPANGAVWATVFYRDGPPKAFLAHSLLHLGNLLPAGFEQLIEAEENALQPWDEAEEPRHPRP